MIYLENIFICLTAPLLIAFFLLQGETKRFIGFFCSGIIAFLLSAYVNSFFSAALIDYGHAGMTAEQIMIQITPICEEALKALPVFLFVAVTSPKAEKIVAVSLAAGLGFATFENICYITQQGAGDFFFALIRGFSAGVMHAVCAAILGYGLVLMYRHRRMAIPGAFALLCVTSTFHGIYNLLVSGNGAIQTVGYFMPLITAAVILLFIVWCKDLPPRGTNKEGVIL